jgi:hypothetical protein
MNRENVQRLRDHIAALPPEAFRFDMVFNEAGWEAFHTPAASYANCNTVACVAGWACVMQDTHVPPPTPDSPLGPSIDSAANKAAAWLELGVLDAYRLFFGGADLHWPNQGRDEVLRRLDVLLSVGSLRDDYDHYPRRYRELEEDEDNDGDDE